VGETAFLNQHQLIRVSLLSFNCGQELNKLNSIAHFIPRSAFLHDEIVGANGRLFFTVKISQVREIQK
jgi:hypothetical protein